MLCANYVYSGQNGNSCIDSLAPSLVIPSSTNILLPNKSFTCTNKMYTIGSQYVKEMILSRPELCSLSGLSFPYIHNERPDLNAGTQMVWTTGAKTRPKANTTREAKG